MAFGDGKMLRSFVGGAKKAGSFSSGTNTPQIRSQRIKTLFRSVDELNKSLLQLAGIAEPLLAKLDAQKAKNVAHELAQSVDALTAQLAKTNEGLTKLAGNRTLLGLAFAGDGEEILDKLCASVDKITKTVREIRERFA